MGHESGQTMDKNEEGFSQGKKENQKIRLEEEAISIPNFTCA